MDLFLRIYNDSLHDKYFKNVRNVVCYPSKEKYHLIDGSEEDLIFCSFTDNRGKILQFENCIDLEVL